MGSKTEAKIKHLEGKHKTVTAHLVLVCDDAELRLYLFLKFHALEKHDCFPKIETIVSALKWSKSKVIRMLARMERVKRLTVMRNHRQPNVYDITWYDLENESGFVHRGNGLGCQNDTQLGVKTRPSWVSKRDPNYKEINNKEITTRAENKFSGDNSSRRQSEPRSIGDILKRRKT